MGSADALPPIVSRAEWEKARADLLVREKELTRLKDVAVASFELTPVQPRAYPAFEIRNVEPNWRLMLDGQTVASSTTPVTPLGVAHYVADGRRLLLVYLDTIPANASTEKRTFTLEQL